MLRQEERKTGVKDPILVRDFIKEAKKTSQYLQSLGDNGDESNTPTIGKRIQHGDDGTPK